MANDQADELIMKHGFQKGLALLNALTARDRGMITDQQLVRVTQAINNPQGGKPCSIRPDEKSS